MKKFLSQFFLRGLTVAAGGPLVLAVIYGILGANGTITALPPQEVCLSIVTLTVLAFFAGGMTAIYQVEKLPLLTAILLHGGALYAAYLLIYLINGWLPRQWGALLTFTGIFVAGYVLIWLVIYWINRRQIQKLNEKLKSK